MLVICSFFRISLFLSLYVLVACGKLSRQVSFELEGRLVVSCCIVLC